MKQERTPPHSADIQAVSDLVIVAGHLRPKTVVIAGGDREDDLRLVESARDHGIVDRCILVGDAEGIQSAAALANIEVPQCDIIATETPEQTAARTVEYAQKGDVDVILKGNIPTPILNRAMLGITARQTISLVTVFDTATVADGRPLLLTDPGVTTVCTFGRMLGLVQNAVDVARSVLGIERPKVAILAANEKQIDSLPSTAMGSALTRHAWPDATVYGPLSLDLAVDPESVRLKGLPRPPAARAVAGQADILVCPGLDSANVLYKMIMQNVSYGIGTFAGITVGVQCPYVILSRADNVETKLQSIALCSIAAERMEMGEAAAQQPTSKEPAVGPAEKAAERAARKIGALPEDTTFVVACLGPTPTVAAVKGGKVVDNETVPASDAQTSSAVHSDGTTRPTTYRLAKAIGAMCVATGPELHAVVLAGDAVSAGIDLKQIKQRVAHLAPVLTLKERSPR